MPDPVNEADDQPAGGCDSRDIHPLFLTCGHARYLHGSRVSGTDAAVLAREQPTGD
jgi:hypothetical protein